MPLTIKRLPVCAAALFLVALLITSCSKEKSGTGTRDEEEAEVSQVSSSANMQAEGLFASLFDDVLGANNDVGLAGTGVFYSRMDTMNPVPPCYTVTIDHPGTGFFPVRITVDFGSTGCTGPDGRVRRGKIISEYSARLINPGATAETVFDNFYIDTVKIEGTLRITNTATVNTPDRKFKVEVINGMLSMSNGNYIKWNSTRNITQITGSQTPTLLDDILKIEGAGQGQALRGNLLVAWQSSITEPLIRRFTCQWIVRGKISSARLNAPANSPWTAVLDFGNGACDNQAVLTINGQTTQITLP